MIIHHLRKVYFLSFWDDHSVHALWLFESILPNPRQGYPTNSPSSSTMFRCLENCVGRDERYNKLKVSCNIFGGAVQFSLKQQLAPPPCVIPKKFIRRRLKVEPTSCCLMSAASMQGRGYIDIYYHHDVIWRTMIHYVDSKRFLKSMKALSFFSYFIQFHKFNRTWPIFSLFFFFLPSFKGLIKHIFMYISIMISLWIQWFIM